MKKLLNNPWFVAALAIVAVVFVGASLFDQKQLRRSRPETAFDESAVPDENDFESDANSGEPRSIREALAALVIPETVRDPIAPSYKEADSTAAVSETLRGADETESLRLTAIWEQGATLLLVINNHIQEVGDRIGRLTIESADIEGVWLTHWKGRDFLPFGGEFTLVTPASQSANSTPASDES